MTHLDFAPEELSIEREPRFIVNNVAFIATEQNHSVKYMNSHTTSFPQKTENSSTSSAKHLLQGLIFLPFVAIFLVYGLWSSGPTFSPTDNAQIAMTTLSVEELEERFGIRIRLIGVTAAGGMIDFRYKIIDKEKADFLVGLGTDPPSLLVGDDVELIIDDDHLHGDELIQGRLYFHFYPNVRGVVKPGTPVVVSFGSIQSEPIVAQ